MGSYIAKARAVALGYEERLGESIAVKTRFAHCGLIKVLLFWCMMADCILGAARRFVLRGLDEVVVGCRLMCGSVRLA